MWWIEKIKLSTWRLYWVASWPVKRGYFSNTWSQDILPLTSASTIPGNSSTYKQKQLYLHCIFSLTYLGSDLLHWLALSQCCSVSADGIKVHSDTKWNTNLICSSISSTNWSSTVINLVRYRGIFETISYWGVFSKSTKQPACICAYRFLW